MKYNIEIEIDDNDNVKVSVPAKLLANLCKSLATVVPKGIDAFFATSFGVFQVLGAKRYFELALPVIKGIIPDLVSKLRRHHATDRGTAKDNGSVSKGEVSSPGVGQKS